MRRTQPMSKKTTHAHCNNGYRVNNDTRLAVGAGGSAGGGGVGTSGALLSIEAAALLLFLEN